MCVQKTTNNPENETMKQVKKYNMKVYIPEVDIDIDAPLTPEQVQMYRDFIQAEREKYDQRTEYLDCSWEDWLEDAFVEANFTYRILCADEIIDAEVLFVDLEHPIED